MRGTLIMPMEPFNWTEIKFISKQMVGSSHKGIFLQDGGRKLKLANLRQLKFMPFARLSQTSNGQMPTGYRIWQTDAGNI